MGAGFQGSAETPRQTTSYLTGLTRLSLCHTGTQGALGLFTARLAHILLATHAVMHIPSHVIACLKKYQMLN